MQNNIQKKYTNTKLD